MNKQQKIFVFDRDISNKYITPTTIERPRKENDLLMQSVLNNSFKSSEKVFIVI